LILVVSERCSSLAGTQNQLCDTEAYSNITEWLDITFKSVFCIFRFCAVQSIKATTMLIEQQGNENIYWLIIQ
jgi:hypothetical protein